MLKPHNVADVKFELLDAIGAEGKNSEVFSANDLQLDAKIVIKKIAKNSLDADRYFEEAANVYTSAHPNVVSIHYACQDDQCIYLAMPFFSRGSLKRLMSEKRLTVREMIVISTQILGGLHNIHSKGLVHFDVKPDNILISDRGEALVADFGLARSRGNNGLAEQDRIYGKAAPPEAFTHEEHDNRFDIYQVGLTLFRMAVGDEEFYRQFGTFYDGGQFDRHAFRVAVVNQQFPNTDSAIFPEHIPDQLIRVIRNCLKSKEDRYQSCIGVVNDLAAIDGELLDWQYSKENGNQSWEKHTDDYVVSIRLDEGRRSEATKRRHGGQARRISEYCNDSLNRQSLKRFLREM